MDISVDDHPRRHRYEATVRDAETETETKEVVGFVDYTVQGRLVVFSHTEVDPAFEGKGIGSTLVRTALDDVRRQGRRAVPVCPFVRTWIDRHPDYADLVTRPRQ